MDPRLQEAVRCARDGDPRAFRTITELIGPDLIRFLTFYMRGDADAAHDMAQETFLRAWGNRDAIQDADHMRGWCFRVARCKAASWMRRRRPPGRLPVPLECVDEEERAEAKPWTVSDGAAQDGDLLAALRRSLDRLPENYAGPIHLYYLLGYSTRETADLLGLTVATVKMRLHRARRFLHAEIRRYRAGRASALPMDCRRSTP